MVVTLNGAHAITDVSLVRAALIEAGFPSHLPNDAWIQYWLNKNASLEAILRLALGRSPA